MKRRKISVYLILPSEHLITKARYLRLILLVAMTHFLRSERGEHQVLMLLDEFANLGPLQVIESGYGLIAGHGVTLWSFVQNLTQLQHLYPKNWETFLANSSVVTVSNVNDVTTAEYFSHRAGKVLITKQSIGQGNSTSYNGLTSPSYNYSNNSNLSVDTEDSLPVAALYEANPDNIFIYFDGQARPTQAMKLVYDIDCPFEREADPNPMHMEEPVQSSNRTIIIIRRYPNGSFYLARSKHFF